MPRVLVFDVNETLLDLRALDPHFVRVFGDASVRQQWFAQLLQSALVATVTNAYSDFGTIAGAALDMIAARRSIKLSPEDRIAILGGIRSLPPHPDVRAALERLRGAGFRLATLTNSTRQVAEAQLTNAGLIGLFEKVISADEIRLLKPASQVYHYAAQQLGITPDQVRLVAAHAWDIAGALRAGCAAAFVARPGMVLDPLAPKPDVVGKDLLEVTEQILKMDASS